MNFRICFFALILLTASGCAGQQDMVRKQAEMESRLEILAQSNQSLTSQVAQLSDEVRRVKDQIQIHTATIREMKSSVENISNQNKNTARQMERPVAAETKETKIELINNDVKPKEDSDASSAAYMNAFGLYSTNKYPEAIKAFESYMKKYPNSGFAVNAQYWIGECYYSMSDFPKALESFKRVVSEYPAGKKVPDAMLKIGYTQFILKERDKADETFRDLVEKFPESPAAMKAKERLGIR